MRKLFGLIFLLMTGTFCACHGSQETSITTPTGILTTPFSTPEANVTGLPENIKTPSQNPALTREPSPTSVSGLEDGLLPIDEAHFTSEAFREYIYETYDKDRDGMLSAKEREAVKEIDLQSFGEMRFLNETLDGFEQFPCLDRKSVV